MASGKTEHLGLSQWSADDRIAREDFNADNRIIDAALAGLSGGCRVVTGTYVGDGQAKTMSLTFDAPPLVVFISGANSANFLAVRGGSYASMFLNGAEYGGAGWNGNTLSWGWRTSNYPANWMQNSSGVTYTYVAVLAA